jgi:hypothetical protein
VRDALYRTALPDTDWVAVDGGLSRFSGTLCRRAHRSGWLVVTLLGGLGVLAGTIVTLARSA